MERLIAVGVDGIITPTRLRAVMIAREIPLCLGFSLPEFLRLTRSLG